MKAEFWHERWEKGEIGFHQHEFNRHMQEFVGRLEVPAGARVLVPLCGKSRDMLWLADRGLRVTGIEISERATRDFFRENEIAFEVRKRPEAVIYAGGEIEIFCADIFTLSRRALPSFDAVYDRASLVALPPEMRTDYADLMAELADPGVRSLLVTLDYPQEEMRGPPFSVTQDEVERLFGSRFDISQLHTEDCLAKEPRFKKKGLTRLQERVFILQKRQPEGTAPSVTPG